MKKYYNKLKRKYIKMLEYRKKNILSGEQGNDYIFDKLQKNEPFFVTRIGATELEVLSYYFFKNKKFDNYIKIKAHKHAGIFPEEDNALIDFSKEYTEGIMNADCIGVWFNKNEGKIIRKFNNNCLLTELRSLEPYYWEKPWSIMLKDKKVLVIHPFKDSIKEQYKKRKKLFKNDILVDFDLKVLKSVQSMKGNYVEFDTWINALNSMKNEINNYDFDVAIIGAGAYGLPLGAYIKNMGKQAIHIGGATQLLFGIRGARWDEHEFISKLYNEFWIRPSKDEVYESAKEVENGCYW